MRPFLIIVFVTGLFCASGQQIQMVSTGTKTSIRGMSVVSDSLIWVSGSNGMIGKSEDGGSNWDWMQVPSFETRDFRDIEAFDNKTAVVIAIAEPAKILKTSDGGHTWNVVFTDSTKGMFLDAMNFSGSRGIVIGDPINNKVFMAFSDDSGDHWKVSEKDVIADKDEAFFASSGTNVAQVLNAGKAKPDIYFVSGGKRSRLFAGGVFHDILIAQGAASQGANSIAVDPTTHKAIIVGGDFSHDTASAANCVIFELPVGGKEINFSAPKVNPHGYKSCVAFISSSKLVTCGTSGVDVSEDGGVNWKNISAESFHVCARAAKGINIFLAGSKGRVAKLVW